MNKLLYRVFTYMLFAIFISLILVSSIEMQLLDNGKFLERELIAPKELSVFYNFINDYVNLRGYVEGHTLSELMTTSVNEIDKTYQLNDIVAIYSSDGKWLPDSDMSIDLTNAKKYYEINNNPILRILLPNQLPKDYYLSQAKTLDRKEVFVVTSYGNFGYETLNKCIAIIYKMRFFTIILALLITFVPVAISLAVSYLIPLKRLRRAADTIAVGDLNFNIRTQGLDEIKELGKSFEYMRRKLEESRKREQYLKESHQQLIANMSHDLKTPITSVKGYVEALLDGKGNNPERMEKYLKTIQSKTIYLNAMINDLFLFSQLDLGEYTLEKKLWDSAEFIKILMEPIQLWVEDAGWHFEIRTPIPKAPLYIDMMRISQVMENIVQNSLKYATMPGNLTVECAITNHYFCVSMSDTGIGISQDALPYVFEPFYREDDSRSQKMGGSGLGLAICKKIVELHGGQVKAESELGKGTKITLYFPLGHY